jgi:hypothetical protein
MSNVFGSANRWIFVSRCYLVTAMRLAPSAATLLGAVSQLNGMLQDPRYCSGYQNIVEVAPSVVQRDPSPAKPFTEAA